MAEIREPESIDAAISRRLAALLADLEVSERRLQQLLPRLRDLRDLAGLADTPEEPEESGQEEVGAPGPVEADEPESPATVPLQVERATVDQLLELQEQLANVPGVEGVSISAMGQGEASLLVQLGRREGEEQVSPSEPPPDTAPTVVCVMCGKVISEGSEQVSHGLCPDCTGSFLRGESAR